MRKTDARIVTVALWLLASGISHAQPLSWYSSASLPGPVTSMAVDSSHQLFVGTTTGLFRTSNQGLMWDTLQPSPPANEVASLACKDSSYLFCISPAESFRRSTDAGNSWESATSGFLWSGPNTIVVHPNGEIFTLVSTGMVYQGVYRSSNNGTSWHIESGIGIYPQGLFVSPAGNLFVSGGSAYNLSRSTDLGSTWSRADTGLPAVVSSLVFHQSAVLSSTSYPTSSIYASTNGGSTWHESAAGLTSTHVGTLVVNGRGQIFAGTDNGVYRSVDGGSSWVQVNNGLDESSITRLVVDRGGYLFAGTSTGRVYRTRDATTGIAGVDDFIADQCILAQNYPNPFNPSTSIQYDLPQRSHVILSVYDVLGRRVAILVDGMYDAGRHRAAFHAHHLASGVYFCRLYANGLVQTKKMILQQ